MAERSFRRIPGVLAAVLLALLGPGTALADQTTGTVDVQATILPACFIGSGAINFGNVPGLKQGEGGHIDNSGEEQADTTGHSIWYACSKGTFANVFLTGAHDWFDGNTQAFRMAGPTGDYLSYRIYTDANRTILALPDGGAIIGMDGDGTEHTIDLYGSLSDADVARVVPGAYTDVITLTVLYNLGA